MTDKKTLFISLLLVIWIISIANAGTTKLISKSSIGESANNHSILSSINADGSVIAFQSDANNLVNDDTNGYGDIFVYDKDTNLIERVSISSDGIQADCWSQSAVISGNGRYVVFSSCAKNLAEDATFAEDIFIYDRMTKVSKMVSSSNYYYAASVSPDISYDGRYIVFRSSANDFVANDTNNTDDIFVYDNETNTIELVSKSSIGTISNSASFGPKISSDGRFVVYNTTANNLDPNDTNNRSDIYLFDRQNQITTCLTNSFENVGAPSISGDGSKVAFAASYYEDGSTNWSYEIFVCDTTTKTITKATNKHPSVQYANGSCFEPTISRNGRFISFMSNNIGIVDPIVYPFNFNDHDTQIYIKDLEFNTTERVSLNDDSVSAERQLSSYFSGNLSSVSDDGRYVSFSMMSDNLAPFDFNNAYDVFLRDRANDNDEDGYLFLQNIISDDCNDGDPLSYPGAADIVGDGKDQDCNGYDLTITATANYKSSKDRLTVDATSSLGAAANLVLSGYGPMTFAGNKWSLIVEPAGGNPGTITVIGIEGAITAQVQ